MRETRAASSNAPNAYSMASSSAEPSALRRNGLSKASVAIPSCCRKDMVSDTSTLYSQFWDHRKCGTEPARRPTPAAVARYYGDALLSPAGMTEGLCTTETLSA